MSAQPVYTTSKKIRVGLGDAIQRLVSVEIRLVNGLSEVEEKDLLQRQLIIDALNLTQLDLGFDCNEDGTPDTIDIFEKAADTSCCRVVTDAEACCRVPVESSAKTKKTKGKSRASQATEPVIEVVTPRAEPPSVPAPVEEITPDSSPSEKKDKKQKGFLSSLFGNDKE